MSTTVVSSVTEIGKDQWEALVSDHATYAYGWVKTVEETHRVPAEPRYVLVRDGGRLLGVAPCAVLDYTPDVFTLNENLLGRLGKWVLPAGISFLPALVCTNTRADGSHFLISSDLQGAARSAVMRELLEAVEDEARRLKLGVAFVKLDEGERELITLLQSRGYNSTVSAPDCRLDVSWSSFEEYLQHIRDSVSKKMYKNVRREIRENTRAGVRITRLEDWTAVQDRLYELLNLNYQGHNGLPFAYRRDFFDRLRLNCPDSAVIYTAVKEGVMVGAALGIKGKKAISVPSVGVDHERAGNDFTYFNIGLYRPIADAIEEGIEQLHIGCAVYEVKLRRGCSIRRSYLFHKAASSLKQLALRPWFKFHGWWWQRRKFSAFLRQSLERTAS